MIYWSGDSNGNATTVAGGYWQAHERIEKTSRIDAGRSCRRVGVARVSYTRYELGICAPDITRLPAIAKLYGCRIDDLFDEMDANTSAQTRLTKLSGGIQMLTIGKKDSCKVNEIVIGAICEMQAVMTRTNDLEMRVKAARVIADLARSLDTRPNILFGDINTDFGEEDTRQTSSCDGAIDRLPEKERSVHEARAFDPYPAADDDTD